jgi:carbohydrate kinase (thermoresistant glucokinase family)
MMIVVMGVAGCGKSSVGQALAARLGWPMLEGDAFHPQVNKDKMASGTPLSDEDRWPWLDEIAAEMRRRENAGEDAVVACSALKRVYRDRLRRGVADVRFVHLTGSRSVHEDRIRSRTGHFMPATMLESQLATLEPPGADEAALAVDIDQPLAAIVDSVTAWLD